MLGAGLNQAQTALTVPGDQALAPTSGPELGGRDGTCPADAEHMPFHPLAGIFPLPGEDELRAMADDIADHGLREPIATLEGRILDGRCRYLACKIAGVEPRFESHDGEEPISYVLSRNFHRRHLTQPQRAMVAARLANLKLGANQHSEGVPIGTAAVMLNVSQRSVARAKEILRCGTPELVQAVESSEVSLLAGTQISRMPQQRALKFNRPGSSLALPDSGSGPGSQSSAATSTRRFPGWIWGDVIPQSGVTVIVGGAATVPVAIKVAATVCRGEDWPDYSRAPRGGVFWMSAANGFVEQLHPQIAPPVPSFNVHLIPPERDEFGLPIRHFALDLDRLRSQVKKTTGVELVTLDSLSDYVRRGDVEHAIKNLRPAIEALNQFAIENEVAIVLPCELPTGPGIAISRAVNAFTAIPEIATLFVARGQSKLAAVKLPTGNGIREFGFRIRCRNSMPTVVWDKLADDTMGGSLFDFEPPTESGFVTPSVEEKNPGDAGGDDHASAIPKATSNEPTASELAHTADAADAAEAGKSDLSKATPPSVTAQAADDADAGIKNRSTEFVSRRIIGGRTILVLRYRRHGKAKKPSASKHPE